MARALQRWAIAVASSPLAASLVVFVFGLVVAILAGSYLEAGQRREQIRRFDDLAQRAAAQLQARMQTYVYGLRGARGAILAAGVDDLSRSGFHDYIASRELKSEFPGARGYSFIRRVRPGQEADFLRRARADGWPDFRIKALAPHDGDRWVIQYIEPVAGNTPAIGLDIASEPIRRRALQAAIANNAPTLTEPVTLVQADGKANHGFLILLPVFASGHSPATPEARAHEVAGLTYVPLLIDEVLETFDFRGDEFAMTIQTGTASGRARPFYASREAARPAVMNLVRRIPVPLYGQVWQVEFRARPAFLAALNQPDARLLSAQIMILSFLLSALLHAYLGNRQRRVQVWMDKARLAAIIESANDAIIGKDLRGRVTSWNQAAERIFGYPESQALGRSLLELIVPPSHHAEEADILRRIRRGEVIPHFNSVRRRADGQLIHVSITISPIRDEQGTVVGAAKVVRDITEQLAAEDSIRDMNASLEEQVVLRTAELELARRDLQTVFDAMPSMIGYWDRNQVNRVANRAYHRWFGIDPGKLPGMHISALLGPEIYQKNLPYIEAALRGEAQVFERSIPSPDGSGLRHSLAHYLPDVVAGEVRGFYVIVHDVTEITEQRLQLTAALRENEVLLRTINQQMLYSVTDVAGRIIEVNDNFCRISGYTREELIGQTHRQINSGFHSAEFWQGMWRDISSGQAWHGEVCNLAKSGELYWVDSVIAPFMGANGRVERYVSVRTDITKRKRAEAELGRVADLLGNVLKAASEVSIIATDADGLITLFNAGAENLLQYAAADVIGRQTPAQFHCPLEVAARAAELSAEYGEAITGFRVFVQKPELEGAEVREWTYVRKSGERIMVSLAVTTMRDQTGVVTGYLGVAQDITVRHRYEQALREAKLSAEAANQAKSEFLANMSHEIRTPMNGILGLCYLLERQEMSATSRDMVSKIHGASRSLLGIINDVLDFSKIEARHLALEQIAFRLDDVLDGLASIAAGAVSDKPVKLIVGAAPAGAEFLRGDPMRLGQVLTNLVSNAIKFTRQGSVTVSVSLAAQPPGETTVRLRFSVRDTGIGIASDKLKLIFSAFSQADNTISRSFGGTGLGLTISRNLVELMGGSIDVSSVPGAGSEFVVELPFERATAAEVVRPGSSAQSTTAGPGQGQRLTGVRVLVVDDSELNREVAEYILAAEGASVASAPDGQVALTRLTAQPDAFDIVLMDIQMPVMDGYTATRRLRANPALQHLPVLALTAGAMSTQRDTALAAGMDGFIAKPFDVEELIATVVDHVGGVKPAVVPAGQPDAEVSAFMAQFAQRFREQRGPELLSVLDQYLQSGEEDMSQIEVRRVLHVLAGEAALVGKAGIGDQARAIEQRLDGQTQPDQTLRQSLGALVRDLRAWVSP